MTADAGTMAAMHAIRIHKRIESQQINLPELVPLIGHDVEIIVLDSSAAESADTAPVKRRAGSAKGQIKLAADFDAPLDDFAEYTP